MKYRINRKKKEKKQTIGKKILQEKIYRKYYTGKNIGKQEKEENIGKQRNIEDRKIQEKQEKIGKKQNTGKNQRKKYYRKKYTGNIIQEKYRKNKKKKNVGKADEKYGKTGNGRKKEKYSQIHKKIKIEKEGSYSPLLPLQNFRLRRRQVKKRRNTEKREENVES